MKDCHIQVSREENKGYIADIPDLKHCSAFGETSEDALLAKNAWLEAARAIGKSIPRPRYHLVIYQTA